MQRLFEVMGAEEYLDSLMEQEDAAELNADGQELTRRSEGERLLKNVEQIKALHKLMGSVLKVVQSWIQRKIFMTEESQDDDNQEMKDEANAGLKDQTEDGLKLDL